MIINIQSDSLGRPSRFLETVFALMFSFGLLSSVVLPMVPIGGLGLYLTTLISPLVLLIALIGLMIRPVVSPSVAYIALMGGMVIVSSLVSWSVDMAPVSRRDIVESVKYWQFFPYLLLVPLLFDSGLSLINRSVVLASLVFLVLGMAQILYPYGVVSEISRWYLGDGSVHLQYLDRRITVTGSNPNVASVIACFFSIFYFSIYALSRNKLYLIAAAVFFVLSFMTQSRTGLIAIVFSISCYYFLFFRERFFVKFFVAFSCIATVVALIFIVDLSYVYLGIEQVLEGRNNSVNVRLEKLQVAMSHFMNWPLTGVGPAKMVQSTIIDSEYLLIIQRYGLLGFIVTFAYILYLLRLSINNISHPWGATLFTFTLFVLVAMLTNNIFAGYQLMSLVILSHVACILSGKRKLFVKRIP